MSCSPGVGVWTLNGNSVEFKVCAADGETWVTVGGSTNFGGAYAALTGKPVLGTAAATAATDYATAAQGTKADAAVQPAALNAKANLAGALFTGAIGYTTGAGGAVTQQTNKATGVTLNTLTGAITMNAAALAAAAEVSFTVTNSAMAATDNVIASHASAGTGGAYTVQPHTFAAGSFRIMVGNMSAGSLSEAIVLRYTILKGASA